MSTPVVPPRPQRNSQQQAGPSVVKNDAPLIPARPVRKTDPSPDGEARSPLNFPPTAMSSKPQVSKRTSQELPRRPPSVSLPTLGNEGDEYSSFDQLPAEAHGVSLSAEEQTRNVAADLPMHQPRASVPQSTATKNIQRVTDTDSITAAAAGIGRARPADDVHKLPPGDASPARLSRVTSNNPRRAPSTEPPNALRAKASFTRSTSSLQPLERTTSRPGSLYGGDDAEHGIPEIGKQVPLLAMAGDVQMPTPGAHASSIHAPGIGFFNDGSTRSHHRKRSSRHEFGPPDSYGIRHDQDHQDQFEKEWVKKHPAEAAKEGYYNHLPKPETALSSEQLNRIVFGESPAAAGTPGTPGEEDAIEEYLSRVSSPAKVPIAERKKRSSSDNVDPESPLRHPFANRLHPNDALEVEDAPKWNSKFIVDSDHEHEHADGTPILASDEMLKRPSSAFMHAAVVPEPHADDDYYYDSDHPATTSRRNSAQPHSRPSSRPSSGYGGAGAYTGGPLHRFISREEEHHSGVGTPLEEIEEYEPLFPEGEEGKKKVAVQKVRPDLAAMHHFPSQDVWEDTPSSLQYMAEVSTPELERMQNPLDAERTVASSFETPEQEKARRTQNTADTTSDKKTFLKPHFKSGVLEELHDSHRPVAHRFPSSDVWEDTPSSMYATTTVSTPEMDDTRSPPDERPTTMAIPGSQDDDNARATTGHGLPARPTVPSRPERKSKLAQEVPPDQKENKNRAPSVPDRPKPIIPARPQRPAKSDQADGASLEKKLSGGSDDNVTSPPLQKAKPAVPARPAGSKIAALQAGFMNDLNNRLKIGPQGPAPKKEEAEFDDESEKQPLADARKSRARGPPRRKPAASPASDRKSSATFAFSPLITVWTIDEEDELKIHSEDKENKSPEATRDEAEETLEENEKHNTESAAPSEDAAEIASRIVQSPDPGAVAAEHHASQAGLEAALAAAGAGPAPLSLGSPEMSKAAPTTADVGKDEEVQTGEIQIETTQPTGEVEKTTIVQGGKASEDGDVILQGAKEELSAS